MEHLPVYLTTGFGLTTLLAIWLFYRAAHYNTLVLIALLAWIMLQGAVALSGFYTVTDAMPPRFVLLVGPPFIAILFLFALPRGRQFIDQLSPGRLTLLHTVRIPVELALWSLYLHRGIPQLMTFEGRNFDILAGLTAPLVYYFGYVQFKLNRRVLFIWNLAGLALLLNIVVNGILSAPFPFQQFAFEQPNVAVLYFPFAWLPGCIVPLVLLSHLAGLRKLVGG